MQFKKDYKIYLVDDDAFYITIFQQHLINLGYTDITIFSDPEACVSNLGATPDIIFYDNGIDFSKGLDILKQIKRHNPNIYMIFLCEPEAVENVIQSLKYGAFDYLVKGEDDIKNIESVLNKIYRINEILQNNSIVRFKRSRSDL